MLVTAIRPVLSNKTDHNRNTAGALADFITSLALELDMRDLKIEKQDVVIKSMSDLFHETSKDVRNFRNALLSKKHKSEWSAETLESVVISAKQSLSTLKVKKEGAGAVKNEHERTGGDVRFEDTPIKGRRRMETVTPRRTTTSSRWKSLSTL